MNAAIGVLCERKRVEEKQVIQSLADAGVPAIPVPPSALPLPVVPCPPAPPVAGAFGAPLPVVLDRCQDRVVAAAVLPIWKASGAMILGAGLAATANRLAVASALAAAGVARPATYLVTSEEAGLAAVEHIGYPATLLPLTASSAPVPLYDRDTAEAVFEHRQMLGGAHDIVGLVQAGAITCAPHATVVVVAGEAVGIQAPVGQSGIPSQALALAESAARALGADIVGIEVLLQPGGPVVWDIVPTPDFRDASPCGPRPIALAIAELAAMRLIERTTVISPRTSDRDMTAALRQEVGDGVALAV
jgi:hypothetical protein